MKKLLVVIMLMFLVGCEETTEMKVEEWDSCDVYLWRGTDNFQYETMENVTLEKTELGVVLTYKLDGMMYERLVKEENIRECIREKW